MDKGGVVNGLPFYLLVFVAKTQIMFASLLHLPPSSPNPKPLYLKFNTSHHENLRYLTSLGVIPQNSQTTPPPDTLTHILSTVQFLKSKGIFDNDFPRLAFLCPQLFSQNLETTQIEPVFDFLTDDLRASIDESRGIIVHCPNILFSNVEYCLRPTLAYLQKLGLENLNVPSKTNAHLLDTRVEKLRGKLRFLKSIGFNHEEAARACVRMPAIFGYNVDGNLRPKYEFLVYEMERGMEELKEFPQYFGFSLEKRIRPRHWHLKKRNVRIKLNRMLMWSDDKFYSKWK